MAIIQPGVIEGLILGPLFNLIHLYQRYFLRIFLNCKLFVDGALLYSVAHDSTFSPTI